ncbi:MAG TPA: 1-deoxy-D-xylulose-5-phosphate reductoisomerase [Rubricoccaceae bacterium]|nr:1-deoxy-D-xylulose-5-phosphate reductoisomerase [Rubricoccaceae bacterium]
MLPSLRRFPVRASDALPRGLALLGATGSIGTQTLEVARLFPERLRVCALTANGNWEGLAEQARVFCPDLVAIADGRGYAPLKDALAGTGIRVVAGEEGLAEAATLDAVETVVAAVIGFAGLRPTLAAIRAGKTIALANKEALVVAGALVERLVREAETVLLPIDSEHSALFQCLVGEDTGAIETLHLTASGGPFRLRPTETFNDITPSEALAHPNWSMGAKITVDSATMMNKGLEVIEAHWLFGVAPEQIEVVLHPQSIIHSLVTFRDGSTKAQLGVPDMKVPIQYALSFPDRWPAPHARVDWRTLSRLDFEPPDPARFPCLGLAYDALRQGGLAPAVLNAANEAAVALFLQGYARFTDIPRLIEAALGETPPGDADDLDTLAAADAAARAAVEVRAGALAS